MRSNRYDARGFSLLEMMVAIAILALSLGALYQAVSGATRNVRSDEKYAYAVELARSLLANNAMVPRSGWDSDGKTRGDFSWEVHAVPIDFSRSLPPGALQSIEVSVSWPDGRKNRVLTLYSVVEGLE